MEKIFAEAGIGNKTFFSTEIEKDGEERRVLGFIKPETINDYYLRIWIFKIIFILSTDSRFKIIIRDKNKFKILFGISGNNRK